ncbi:hypothetical protein PN36_15360 [Candidatus Thiomargarita nelsonii]|uniref:HNH endonuclease n=1 Tax=Candidatus Thiomargarita nelsonii TaxID=1003181 RepID=A0A0A6P7B9_9GAMM|nr:hypothetical protein PN36_15360 [Candidatus Thiomargarita nelsonii]
MSNSHISAKLRQEVAEQSRYRCCYCQSQQRFIGILLTVDHIIPESLGGATIDPQTGTTVRIFHPNKQKWAEHFRWSSDGIRIIGVTPIGRATIVAMKLNRPVLLHSRRFWSEAGWHPPPE